MMAVMTTTAAKSRHGRRPHGRGTGHDAPPARLTSISLREESRLDKPQRVDAETGCVYGVKMLGKVSSNTHGVNDVDGSEYTDEALTEALPLYEGAYGYLNHRSRKDPAPERDVREKFCCYHNVQVKEDGLYGDMHLLNPKTEFAQTFLRSAEQYPDAFGLSHDALGDGEVKGRTFVITSIPAVKSVDVVDRPATTKTLFESKERQPVTAKKKTAAEVLESAAKALGKTHLRLAKDYLATDVYGLKNREVLEDDETAEPEDRVHEAFREAMNAIYDGEDGDDVKKSKLNELFKAKTRIASAAEPKDDDAAKAKEGESGDAGDKGKEPDNDGKKDTKESRELRAENAALHELLESGLTNVPRSAVKALARLDSAGERAELIASLKKGQAEPPPGKKTRSQSVLESQGNGGGKPAVDLGDPVQVAAFLRN